MFLIHTAKTVASRDAGRPSRGPYKTGPFYLVSPFMQQGATATANSLQVFPGEPSATVGPNPPTP